MTDLDVNWTAANVTEKVNPRNPRKAACRYEFLEIIVRLALDKYLRYGKAMAASEAVTWLLDEMKPFAAENDSSRWRSERLLRENVDLIYKRYYSIFKHIY